MNFWLVNQHRRWGWSIIVIFLINLVQLKSLVWTSQKLPKHIIMYCMQHEWYFLSFLFFQTNVGAISTSVLQVTSLHPVIRCLTTRLRNAYGWLQLQDRTRGFWSTSTHTLTWKTESASECSVFSIWCGGAPPAGAARVCARCSSGGEQRATCVLGFWFHLDFPKTFF